MSVNSSLNMVQDKKPQTRSFTLIIVLSAERPTIWYRLSEVVLFNFKFEAWER